MVTLMKKIKILLLIVLCIAVCFTFKMKTHAQNEETFTVDYNLKREARAVWVSALVGDISKFSSKSQYQGEIERILDNMEKLNLNIMIFHIRIYNDALYESKYNSWSSLYSTNPSWNALPWIIEECHKRGIEFHAWMNPYRVTSGSYGSLSDVAKRFPNSNAASNPANLVKGSTNIILNPGIPAVQNFLVDVCMEVVEKYDVDAIHFDDYFYVKNVDDRATYLEYGVGETIEDFRRESVNKFIRKLSKSIANYNEKNNKTVELGISPTASWANGDGVVTYDENGKAISNGSKGITQGHYGDYLYCDTLLWVNEGLIDYILPQCYIGTSEGNELFYGTVDWWSKVCKYSRTKLYIGIGIYRASSSGDWSDVNELKKQFDFMSKYDNISGFSLYSYRHLLGRNSYCTKNLENAKSYFEDEALAPEIRIDFQKEINHLDEYYILSDGSKHKIGFEKLKNAKYYVLFRKNNNKFTYLGTGNPDEYFEDNYDGFCEYYIAPVFLDNKIGEYVKLTTEDVYKEVKFFDQNGDYLFSKYVKNYEDVKLNKYIEKEGYNFIRWEKYGNDYKAVYEIITFNVTYYVNDEVYKTITVNYGEDAPDLEFDSQYGTFSGWQGNLKNVTEDRIITSTFKRPRCILYYYNDKKLIKKEEYKKGDVVNIDMILTPEEGYVFNGFTLKGELCNSFIILDNTYLFAKFSKKTYKITYDLDGGTLENGVYEFENGADVILKEPKKDGYKFLGYYENDEKVETLENRDYVLKAKYIKLYRITYHDGDVIKSFEYENLNDVELLKPEKEGYKFFHWINKNEEIITKLNNEDYELFAVWKKIYHIKYDLDGGKAEELISEFVEGDEVSLKEPKKDGYKFIGYFENGIKVDKIEAKDYDLIAKWEKMGCKNSLAVLYTSLSLLLIFIIRKRSNH